jgi:hypothetical protein
MRRALEPGRLVPLTIRIGGSLGFDMGNQNYWAINIEMPLRYADYAEDAADHMPWPARTES